MIKPIGPENRIECGFCNQILSKSDYEAHFCARHPKFVDFITCAGAISFSISVLGIMICLGLLL